VIWPIVSRVRPVGVGRSDAEDQRGDPDQRQHREGDQGQAQIEAEQDHERPNQRQPALEERHERCR